MACRHHTPLRAHFAQRTWCLLATEQVRRRQANAAPYLLQLPPGSGAAVRAKYRMRPHHFRILYKRGRPARPQCHRLVARLLGHEPCPYRRPRCGRQDFSWGGSFVEGFPRSDYRCAPREPPSEIRLSLLHPFEADLGHCIRALSA